MADETEKDPNDSRTDAEQLEDDPQVFILSRELSEVHLLLDNLSCDPDTTICALSTKQPPDGLKADWLKHVCEVSWPPPNSARQKSEQAELLIRAKDYLNRLAKPASGMTIAYTLMVTQKSDVAQPPHELRRPGPDMDETLWRTSLAEVAFPDLKGSASIFRRVMRWMRWLLLVWLLVTCLLSWNVAYGNLTLGEYAAASDRLKAARGIVNDAEAGRRRGVATGGEKEGDEEAADTQPAAATLPADAAVTKAEPEVAYCERWRLIDPAVTKDGRRLRRYETAEQRQACVELEEAQRQVDRASERLRHWLWLWAWLPGIDGDSDDPASTATRLASIMGTAVLPVFYGVLGAAAAVLRSISHKIKTSTLSPRDLSLSLQQLALGAVVGACIGLFIVGGDETLIGPVTLSGSAISFVAGFGVEAVFQALEALISRIFNIAPAATRGESAPPAT